MRPGRILVLNGAPSSGKTTLARALQSLLSEPHQIVGLDRWLSSVPRELLTVVDDPNHPPVDGFLIPIRDGVQIALPTLGAAALEVISNMYASFASVADAGTNLIVDDVLWHPAARAMAIAQFADRDAWLIGVFCPIEIAVEREQARGDRARGGAVLFGDLVHAHVVYDYAVDTSILSPGEAAKAIVAGLLRSGGPTAFRQLRSTLSR